MISDKNLYKKPIDYIMWFDNVIHLQTFSSFFKFGNIISMANIPKVFRTHVASITPGIEKATPIESVQNEPFFFS